MFNINSASTASHLNKLSKNLSLSLPSLLPAQFVREVIDQLELTFRLRIFSPIVTLYGMLVQAFCDDKTCRHAVTLVKTVFMLKQGKSCSPRTASFCNAKKRLPLSFCHALFRKVSVRLEEDCANAFDWKHGKVKVIDGTGFSMPDTAANLARFPRHSRYPKQSIGFPVGRLVAVFSLASGGVVDAVVGPWKGKGSGEVSLLQKLWHCWQRGETLLGDSLFASYWVISTAQKHGIHVVAEFPRRQRHAIFRKKSSDFLLTFSKPKKKPWCLSDKEFENIPNSYTVRLVRLRCAPKGFRPKAKLILTTHMDRKTVTAEDICDLYRRRWQVEVNLRSIKTTMGMDILRGKSPDIVEKDVWSYLLGYNIIRLAMFQAAKVAKRLPDEISFRASQQAVSILLLAAALGFHSGRLGTALLEMMTTSLVGAHPNRYEPRALKRRKKNYAFLNETRTLARKKLCKKYKGCKPAAA